RGVLMTEVQAAKNSWFSKTLGSLKNSASNQSPSSPKEGQVEERDPSTWPIGVENKL
ncbi:hypothetical protein M9458_044092, partial [Cirrhinus mrigala]